MSAQMVDAYLDELLAPLVEEALTKSKIQARSSSVAGVAAINTEDAVPEAVAPAITPEPQLRESFIPSSPPQRPEPRAETSRHEEIPIRATPGTSGTRWLRAALGKDRYAFELLRVQEVVRMSPIIALRGTAAAMLGVMNLRGRVVPVFDLAAWLGTGEVEPDEHARIIVVERDDELIGVLVSAVDDVVTLLRENIEPPLLSTDPGSVVGIARVGQLPTVLLDANALFD